MSKSKEALTAQDLPSTEQFETELKRVLYRRN